MLYSKLILSLCRCNKPTTLNKMTTLVKERIRITHNELISLLSQVERPTFTHIVSLTKPKMRSTNNPYFDKVNKTSKGKYFIGGSYEDMVNNRMVKEGIEPTFESKECSVGSHLEGTKCVLFNEKLNKHYLQYFIFPTSNIKSEFEFEGNSIDKQIFESYLVKKSETSRQPQENKHLPSTLTTTNIKEISLNGVVYVVED